MSQCYRWLTLNSINSRYARVYLIILYCKSYNFSLPIYSKLSSLIELIYFFFLHVLICICRIQCDLQYCGWLPQLAYALIIIISLSQLEICTYQAYESGGGPKQANKQPTQVLSNLVCDVTSLSCNWSVLWCDVFWSSQMGLILKEGGINVALTSVVGFSVAIWFVLVQLYSWNGCRGWWRAMVCHLILSLMNKGTMGPGGQYSGML